MIRKYCHTTILNLLAGCLACYGSVSADFLDELRDPEGGWPDASQYLLDRQYSFLPEPIIWGEAVGVLETELRWDFNPRISALVFAGVGRAASAFSDLGSAATEPAQGLGLRYLIARKLGLRGGFDVALGREDTVFYITVGQNWSYKRGDSFHHS
ncbi:MAG: hypothetical protein AAGA91_01955 [Pseudomonadota bacterium]